LLKINLDVRVHNQVQAQAVKLLARREYGDLELIAALEKRGFSLAIVRTVVASLLAQGLQSNQRYQEHVVLVRRRRGYGPLFMQQLFKQNCSTLVYEMPQSGWDEPALHWLEKRAHIRRGLSMIQARQALQRRGFSSAQIECVLQLWHSRQETAHACGG
jgi:SOS response regulatory protein OraA/RecX